MLIQAIIQQDNAPKQVLVRLSSIVPVEEVPSGVINGVNRRFTTQHSMLPETCEVYLNGIRQAKGIRFTVIDNRNIELSAAPMPGDEIIVSYIKEL